MKKSEIIEAIFTTIITTDVQASGGIGTDNMSAILIFFNWFRIKTKNLKFNILYKTW